MRRARTGLGSAQKHLNGKPGDGMEKASDEQYQP
jgi:hypothetical protein